MPSLSARSNSRCVCRRPSGLAYQSVSSVLDLDLLSFVDFRVIDSSLSLIHGMRRNRPQSFIPNREHYDQVASGRRCTEKFPSFLAGHVFCRDDRVGPLDRFLDFVGLTPCRATWPTLCRSQSKPLTPSSTATVYTNSVHTTRLHIQQGKPGGARYLRGGVGCDRRVSGYSFRVAARTKRRLSLRPRELLDYTGYKTLAEGEQARVSSTPAGSGRGWSRSSTNWRWPCGIIWDWGRLASGT